MEGTRKRRGDVITYHNYMIKKKNTEDEEKDKKKRIKHESRSEPTGQARRSP